MSGLLWLLSQTFQASSAAVDGQKTVVFDQRPWLLLMAGLIVALPVYWWPRRGRPNSLAVMLTLISALLAISLGIATYGPCVKGVYLAPAGWVLELFVGGVESPESPGATCSGTWSPGFQLARVFGLLATVIGAVAAAALLGQQQWTRATIRRSRDVDVVVGLGPAQLELIRALVRDNARRPWRESWIDGRPGWRRKGEGGTHGLMEWLTGMRRADWRSIIARRTRTVVLTVDPNNTWAEEARQVGASVLTADPMDPTIIDMVILRSGWPNNLAPSWVSSSMIVSLSSSVIPTQSSVH